MPSPRSRRTAFVKIERVFQNYESVSKIFAIKGSHAR